MHVRALWYSGFFGLALIGLLVSLVQTNVCCSKPSKSSAICCARSPEWSFVTLREDRKNDGALFALAMMALLSALLQAIIFLFMKVNIVTIYLFIAYNFVNWGWPLSLWAGRYWKRVQAVFVGVGVGLMWAATAFETAMLLDGRPAEDSRVSLPMLYALSICSAVDFWLHVMPFCMCCTKKARTDLEASFLAGEPMPMYKLNNSGSKLPQPGATEA